MEGILVEQHFNQLTAAEDERLSLLVEECGEVLQIIGKIMRHGYQSHNPFDPQKTDNRTLLEKELGHLLHAVDRLSWEGDLDFENIRAHISAKAESVVPWLHHQDPEVDDPGLTEVQA